MLEATCSKCGEIYNPAELGELHFADDCNGLPTNEIEYNPTEGNQKMKQYRISTTFTTNRDLTSIELDQLATEVVTQVLEPSENSTFQTAEVYVNWEEDYLDPALNCECGYQH